MIRYRKLGYVALNVTDLKRSTAFYRDTLGLQPVESERSGAGEMEHDWLVAPGIGCPFKYH